MSKVNVYLVEKQSVYGLDDNLTWLIQFLNTLLDKVPDEYKSSVVFETESGRYEGDPTRFSIYYQREETDSESRARKQLESRRQTETQARELMELARLKEKYPNA